MIWNDVLKKLNGQELKLNPAGEPLTLGSVAIAALEYERPDREETTLVRFKKFRLAEKIQEQAEAEPPDMNLTPKECVMVGDAVKEWSRNFPAVANAMYGRVVMMLGLEDDVLENGA
jgi:hypothetical protein